jgi:hypothetical protein
MPTEIICPSCGRKGELPEAYINKVIRCAQCHEMFRATATAQARPAAAPPRTEAKPVGPSKSPALASTAAPASTPARTQSPPATQAAAASYLPPTRPIQRDAGWLFWGPVWTIVAAPWLLTGYFLIVGSRTPPPLPPRQPPGNPAAQQPAAGDNNPQAAPPDQGGKGRRGNGGGGAGGGRRGRNQGGPAAAAPRQAGQRGLVA